MKRVALAAVVLGGCLYNPTVEVDREAVDVPRGTSTDVLVSINGEEVNDLSGVLWTVEHPDLVTVTPARDGRHLRIGGDHEGETVVHVSAYGQDVPIVTHVGAPALLQIWTEPEQIKAQVGELVEVRAMALDSIAEVVDITFDSRWTVRNESVANLEHDGMMLRAMEQGTTTLHVTHGSEARVIPVSVFK
jgi:hypothetical protein